MNNFFQAFKAFLFVYKTYKPDMPQFGDYWREGNKEVFNNYKHLFLFVFKTFRYKIEKDYIKDYSNLLKDLEDMIVTTKNSKDSYERESNQIWDERNRIQKNNDRYELELIKLKDIIQEKNLVIDKLVEEAKYLRIIK